VTTIGAGGRQTYGLVNEPTPAYTWHAVAGSPITDYLLEWPPDVLALTNVVLTRSEAFRFAVSRVGEWPPARYLNWGHAVEEAGRRWGLRVEDRGGAMPDLLAEEWSAFRERAEMPLEDLARGQDWRLCEALLTLHAIADEACAGLGIAHDSSDADGCVYRARGRELLATTGSLARVSSRFLRVLPKVRTPPTGRPSFSRYACVQGPRIEARWHEVPARHRGIDPRSEFATLLLLPWPLRVRESDFRPLGGSVQRLVKEPFGFFEFAPAEGLDFDLLDRVLVAAREEVNSVDVVLLPESAVDEGDIDELETLLHHHGVVFLQTGARERSRQSERLPGNWIHIGVNPRLEKGGLLPSVEARPWFHPRQNTHHRWSLDESQIYPYHLGGALHPHIRWWEAMDVPRRAVQFVEVAELTLVALVCEDLARNDDVAELIRQVGPTIVMTALLDGPQLSSRWAARYASVLADDPGSAVLTLTSFGMVQRSRPHGREASSVIALWKDPARGVREIPLEPGAQAVVLTVCMDRVTRRSADGRWPVDNGTECFDVAVQQIRASSAGSGLPRSRSGTSTPHVLEADELTILTAWAEGVAEAVGCAPERAEALLAEARAGAPWRRTLGLPEPPPPLTEALESPGRAVRTATPPDDTPTFDGLLAASSEDRPEEQELDGLVRRALLSMVEKRRTRQPTQAD
jgi:hypothetical protein